MIKNYWSCTKFANWLRGTPKPNSGTMEEWSIWEKTAKTKPFRYWLVEEGLDYLQSFLYWPINRIKDIRYYINNRWITKNHALISNLKRGEWHNFDERLLHTIFDELINFVEIELAWMHVVFSKEERKKYKTPWYRIIFRINNWRCPKAGIAYLNWAGQLKFDENYVDKNDPCFGKPTDQALAAQETLALYKWWKEEYPKRLDPGDASGLNAYYEKKRNAEKTSGNNLFLMDAGKCPPSILDLYNKIEKEYEEEDTDMLIRLVKIRQYLWT